MYNSKEFADLFAFPDQKEKLNHHAQMISFRVLAQVEKVCEERGIKKSDLAAMVGTSKSYITQLFRGDKQVNMQLMAKFEIALGIKFEVAKRCTGNCGLNYCDDNGCNERERILVNQ